MTIRIEDRSRVRTLILDRPAQLNAFNEEQYDALTDALLYAAEDPQVAVVVLTGKGRAFSAGQDLVEMAERANPNFRHGRHGFPGLVEALADFPKPLLIAVNGLSVGIGVTLLGFADLVLMSDKARLRCPFTSLGVAAEAASSYLFPQLIGRQNASWLLMSSDWIDAAEAREMGLAWRLCSSVNLRSTAQHYAEALAKQPAPSLRAVKSTIITSFRDEVRAARKREDEVYAALLAGPAHKEALAAFAEKREVDFTKLPEIY
ncbi:enoyl-CoA hydratase/isomerase family protein [Streptomyces sp. NPDC101225]|uniref:enoyl-CoA hydratase/isomerase family protein n=1 Tax=Streptomyces sp. NPDC101225 TaxID=3366135 RepID=UPI003804B1B4